MVSSGSDPAVLVADLGCSLRRRWGLRTASLLVLVRFQSRSRSLSGGFFSASVVSFEFGGVSCWVNLLWVRGCVVAFLSEGLRQKVRGSFVSLLRLWVPPVVSGGCAWSALQVGCRLVLVDYLQWQRMVRWSLLLASGFSRACVVGSSPKLVRVQRVALLVAISVSFLCLCGGFCSVEVDVSIDRE